MSERIGAAEAWTAGGEHPRGLADRRRRGGQPGPFGIIDGLISRTDRALLTAPANRPPRRAGVVRGIPAARAFRARAGHGPGGSQDWPSASGGCCRSGPTGSRATGTSAVPARPRSPWHAGSAAASSVTAGEQPLRDAATDDRYVRAVADARPHGRQPPKHVVQGCCRTAVSMWPACAVSSPPPGQDSGPAASIGHRHGEPRRAIASAMRTDGHDDRAAEHALLQ